MTITNANPCTGYLKRPGSMPGDDCCDAHRGYKQCTAKGSEFGPQDEKGRRDRARCGLREGHDGAHRGFGASVARAIEW